MILALPQLPPVGATGRNSLSTCGNTTSSVQVQGSNEGPVVGVLVFFLIGLIVTKDFDYVVWLLYIHIFRVL